MLFLVDKKASDEELEKPDRKTSLRQDKTAQGGQFSRRVHLIPQMISKILKLLSPNMSPEN